MFGFLKEKLKKATEAFSKNIEDEAEDIVVTSEDVKSQEEENKEKEESVKKKEENKKKSKAKADKKVIEKKIEKETLPETNNELDEVDNSLEALGEKNIENKTIPNKKSLDVKESKELETSDNNSENLAEEIDAIQPPEEPKKKGFFGRLFSKKDVTIDDETLTKEEIKEEIVSAKVALKKYSASNKSEEEQQESLTDELLKEVDEKILKTPHKKDKNFINEESEILVDEKLKETDTKLEESEKIIKSASEKINKKEKEIKEDKKSLKKEPAETIKEKIQTVEEESHIEEPEEESKKKGFFSKLKEGIVAKKLSESKFEDLFFELEIALLENNVAIEIINKIKEDLKLELVDKKLNRFDIEKIIFSTLNKSINEVLSFEPIDLIKEAKSKKPFVIVFVGVNGTGKTTTIGKISKYFENNGLSSVLVAADTFRAGSIHQLQQHADNLNVKLIKHDYGSDPAAVAFDGIKYAKAKNIDVVLIDTAGRLHSNTNLMDELKKIIRVSEPDFKIFIGEAITGNDCIEQAQKFHEAVDIDGIILSKADVDQKGGAALSVSYITKKPIMFMGTGQNYEDLEVFDKKKILENLGLN